MINFMFVLLGWALGIVYAIILAYCIVTLWKGKNEQKEPEGRTKRIKAAKLPAKKRSKKAKKAARPSSRRT